MLSFNKDYFLLSITIFCIELFIALFVNDRIVRPYIGDVLVVILLYCFIKAFFEIRVFIAAIIVLLFSFTVEFLQSINIVEQLGLENSTFATTIIGTSFSWIDLVAYIIGIGLILIVEKRI